MSKETKVEVLTEKRVCELFHIIERNMQQTYKNPKPTKVKPVISEKERAKKNDQYQIIRLGATCKHYGITEEKLLKLIDLVQTIEDKQ